MTITWYDLENATEQQRNEFLSRHHDTGYPHTSRAVAESDNGLFSKQLGVGHPFNQSPLPIRSGARLYPLGYVELGFPEDVYTVIRSGNISATGEHSCNFQIVVVPDERRELVSYPRPTTVNGFTSTVQLQFDDAPDQDVASAVAVESRELVNPPQSTPPVSTGRVVGLHAFNAAARPLSQSRGVELPVKSFSAAVDGELDSIRALRLVETGVLNKEFMRQAVEDRPEVVQPLAEDHRHLGWEWSWGFQVERDAVVVMADVAANRLRLQIAGSCRPQFLAVKSCSLNTGEEDIEFVSTHSKSLKEVTSCGSRKQASFRKGTCMMPWIPINGEYHYEPQEEFAYGPFTNNSHTPTTAERRAAWRAEQGSAKTHLLNAIYWLISTTMRLNDRIRKRGESQG